MATVPTPARKKALAEAAHRFHHNLINGVTGYRYFHETRGFSDETIRRFVLGQVPDDDPDYPDHRGWLCIPYLTPTGFVDLRFRNPDPEGKPKYKSLPGAGPRMFNTTAILQARETLS